MVAVSRPGPIWGWGQPSFDWVLRSHKVEELGQTAGFSVWFHLPFDAILWIPFV